MLYIDLPTRSDLTRLNGTRADACVSIYLTTTPVTRETEASRIEFGNLVREAQTQLEAAGFDKRRLARLLEQFDALQEDSHFWRFQANSLAVFATPDRLRTFRLANQLTSMVQVADRFHLKPLLRATTFRHAAFILALSENAVRLLEVNADLPPTVIDVPGLPKDAASAVGKATLNQRAPHGRLHGSEGQNVRFAQYARQVDAALRGVLAGRERPLILAATGRLADVFPQLNSYANLLPDVIGESPDRLSESELAARARPILDREYAQQLESLQGTYAARAGERRTTTDLSDAARAATFGAVDTLLVDIDSVIPGFLDEETGALELVAEDDARAYDVVDEIVGRALASGARVLALRRQDIPGGGDLAAILRYAI